MSCGRYVIQLSPDELRWNDKEYHIFVHITIHHLFRIQKPSYVFQEVIRVNIPCNVYRTLHVYYRNISPTTHNPPKSSPVNHLP